MKMLNTAAVLLLAYAGILLLNALFYFYWSEGDTSELIRVSVRIVGLLFISYGLVKRVRWAWLIGVIASGLFLALGIIALAFLAKTDLLVGRPYPMIDVSVFVLSVLCLLGALLCLLTPSARLEAKGIGGEGSNAP